MRAEWSNRRDDRVRRIAPKLDAVDRDIILTMALTPLSTASDLAGVLDKPMAADELTAVLEDYNRAMDLAFPRLGRWHLTSLGLMVAGYLMAEEGSQ